MLVPHLDMNCRGIDAIIAAVAPLDDMFDSTLHAVMNQTVTFSELCDDAQAETYCIANHLYTNAEGQARKMDMGIRYADTLKKTASGWRIVSRLLQLDWQQDLPTHN